MILKRERHETGNMRLLAFIAFPTRERASPPHAPYSGSRGMKGHRPRGITLSSILIPVTIRNSGPSAAGISVSSLRSLDSPAVQAVLVVINECLGRCVCMW